MRTVPFGFFAFVRTYSLACRGLDSFNKCIQPKSLRHRSKFPAVAALCPASLLVLLYCFLVIISHARDPVPFIGQTCHPLDRVQKGSAVQAFQMN